MELTRRTIIGIPGMNQTCPEYWTSGKWQSWSVETGFQCPRTYGDSGAFFQATAVTFTRLERLAKSHPEMEFLDVDLDALRGGVLHDFDEPHILRLLAATVGNGFHSWARDRSLPRSCLSSVPVEQLLQIVRFDQLQRFLSTESKQEIDSQQTAVWLDLAKQSGLSPVIDRCSFRPLSHHHLVRRMAQEVADAILTSGFDEWPEVLTVDTFHQHLGHAGTVELLRELRDQFKPFPEDELSQLLQLERAILKDSVGTIPDIRTDESDNPSPRTTDETLVDKNQLATFSGVHERVIRDALRLCDPFVKGKGRAGHQWRYCDAVSELRKTDTPSLQGIVWPDFAVELASTANSNKVPANKSSR